MKLFIGRVWKNEPKPVEINVSFLEIFNFYQNIKYRSSFICSKAVYPSSSKKQKDWDKIHADIVAEEKDEKLEGDAALNK